SEPTKSTLIEIYDKGDPFYDEVYFSGGYNGGRTEKMHNVPGSKYPEIKMNDYRFMWQDCAENTGARHNKYKTGVSSASAFGNNQYVVYRLTDIYFAKAEALWRKAGISSAPSQEVVDLINACKERCFLKADWDAPEAETEGIRYTTSTLTAKELLAERGREFVFEGKRRRSQHRTLFVRLYYYNVECCFKAKGAFKAYCRFLGIGAQNDRDS
ncbi:MAG: RagB/SusD family nutrient uptake outer membrane protein, partial [Eubacteriaceae bacterium]|nr:RagB/SusD family nutrient uptake outer membrane protein [Eubacteriaceae bacterium]